MKKSKIWIIIGIVGILLLVLTFVSPLLIMYYAEEQYFIDQYKKNKTAFEDIKDELFLALERENLSELNLVSVSSFDELIDVYSEVRMPINFYENKEHTKAIFRIINDNMCWEYVLDKNKIEKK